VPIILFSYYNPIFQMGLEKFAAATSEAGVDGVLATDLTPEESVEYRRILHAQNLDTIFLGAPTSTDERLVQIAEVSSGFLYLIFAHRRLRGRRILCRMSCRHCCDGRAW